MDPPGKPLKGRFWSQGPQFGNRLDDSGLGLVGWRGRPIRRTEQNGEPWVKMCEFSVDLFVMWIKRKTIRKQRKSRCFFFFHFLTKYIIWVYTAFSEKHPSCTSSTVQVLIETAQLWSTQKCTRLQIHIYWHLLFDTIWFSGFEIVLKSVCVCKWKM